jgi:hypothetical protein
VPALAGAGMEREAAHSENAVRFDAWPEWGDFEQIRFSFEGQAPHGLEHCAGWPIPSLWYALRMDDGADPRYPYALGGVILDLPSQTWMSGDTRAIPLRPIWPGLILGSLFWAACPAVIVRAGWHTRARLRVRRGLCPHCAYDLRQNLPSGCPECGWNRSIPAPI